MTAGHPVSETKTRIPAGQRRYEDGIQPYPKMTLLETTIAIVTLLIYTAWPILLVFLLLFVWCPPVLLVNVILYSTLLIPAKVFWSEFMNWDLFRLWRQYFNFSYIYEEELDPDNKYLIAEFPHGTFPIGPLLGATLLPKLFPDHRVHSLGASVLFKMPLYKHFLTWLGAQPADRGTFQKLMDKGHVALCVGGVAEIFMQYEDKEQILLSSRKGFIRMALANGVDILPVYHFGNSRLLSIGPRFLMNFCRKIRLSLGVLVGRWGLPIPRQLPIYMVVGKPVKVEKKVSPNSPDFEKETDILHERFVKALHQLYENHKGEFGWKDRPLVIV